MTMKTFQITFLAMLLLQKSLGQSLETIYIHPDVSTHFITSEPIEYVDLSVDEIAGDLPVANILRIKPADQQDKEEGGVLTIVCQKYMVQYRLIYADPRSATTSKFISSLDGSGLLHPEIILSTTEMRQICKDMLLDRKAKKIRQTTRQGMRLRVHRIVTVGDYFFVELSLKNQSNIPFTKDQVRFHLQDQRKVKTTNHQRITLTPEYQLYRKHTGGRSFRNIYVFKKFSFPDDKILQIEVAEEPLSGRVIRLGLNYKKILHAEAW